MRSIDMIRVAPAYAANLPQLFSVECWGGATFDVAMRFLRECPWDRLIAFREAMPNLLLQMLLRSANAVGYTNYADDVVRHFVARAAAGGIDLFRVFDSLNWVENMRVSIDAVVDAGKVADERAGLIAKDIAAKIKNELDYPGQIKVTVIREMRAVEYAR